MVLLYLPSVDRSRFAMACRATHTLVASLVTVWALHCVESALPSLGSTQVKHPTGRLAITIVKNLSLSRLEEAALAKQTVRQSSV